MAFELSDHTKKMYNPAYEEGFLFGKEWWSKYERNRIIKLLEPLGCEYNGVEHDCQNGLGYTTAADLIALIKGETK